MRISASIWFLLSEYITMHGPLNVKFRNIIPQWPFRHCLRCVNKVNHEKGRMLQKWTSITRW